MLWDWLMGSLKPYPQEDEDGSTTPASKANGVNGARNATASKEKAG